MILVVNNNSNNVNKAETENAPLEKGLAHQAVSGVNRARRKESARGEGGCLQSKTHMPNVIDVAHAKEASQNNKTNNQSQGLKDT